MQDRDRREANSPDPKGAADDPLLQLYFAKRANLVRFFAARAGSPAEAEDLAQDLYLKLAARERETLAENPTALLYRIAANLSLDRARGDRRSSARDAA